MILTGTFVLTATTASGATEPLICTETEPDVCVTLPFLQIFPLGCGEPIFGSLDEICIDPSNPSRTCEAAGACPPPPPTCEETDTCPPPPPPGGQPADCPNPIDEFLEEHGIHYHTAYQIQDLFCRLS